MFNADINHLLHITILGNIEPSDIVITSIRVED
jgi:hypothetical protein